MDLLEVLGNALRPEPSYNEITNQVNGKDPISNGSINPSLTVEEMQQFPLETKLRLAHYLQVGAHYPQRELGIRPESFVEYKDLFEYEELQKMSESDINKALEIIHTNVMLCRGKSLAKQYSIDYREGKEIKKATETLHFSGELTLTIGQLCGYVHAVGQWNNFYPENIAPVLREFDNSVPRKNYGVNNCNTGGTQHFWTIKSDYIIINVQYISTAELRIWEKWFKEVGLIKQRALQADSMRLNVDDVPTISGQGEPTHHYLQVIMWWD